MTVETDASDYAIVGILSVTTPDLEIHLIAFHSQSLHDAERNYDTHDKELLAVFDWITLREDSRKHWTSSKSGRRSPNTSLVTHSP